MLLCCSDAAVCNGRPAIAGGPGVFLAVPGVRQLSGLQRGHPRGREGQHGQLRRVPHVSTAGNHGGTRPQRRASYYLQDIFLFCEFC